jgi:hypothetical protein
MEVHSTHTIEERVDRLDPRVKICQKLQGNSALSWAFPHPAKELAKVIVAPKVASRNVSHGAKPPTCFGVTSVPTLAHNNQHH